jgi:diaminohydroxyphosphoribosylaminopyrimidine deaminase/5-amino-6-(5-phosphoribosylamino)uracil reductase
MKIAVSRDGKIAARPGVRTALTSDRANDAIQQARAEVDALAVGSTTLLVDDPRLTPRGRARVRPLTRVVFDRRLRTPVTARLLETLDVGPVVLMTTEGAMKRKPELAATLREKGARLEALPEDDCEVGASLKRLGDLQVVSVIIEGGAAIHRAAWEAGLVDRVQRFVAPVDLGPEGVPWLILSQANLHDSRVQRYGPDTLTEAYVRRID